MPASLCRDTPPQEQHPAPPRPAAAVGSSIKLSSQFAPAPSPRTAFSLSLTPCSAIAPRIAQTPASSRCHRHQDYPPPSTPLHPHHEGAPCPPSHKYLHSTRGSNFLSVAGAKNNCQLGDQVDPGLSTRPGAFQSRVARPGGQPGLPGQQRRLGGQPSSHPAREWMLCPPIQ